MKIYNLLDFVGYLEHKGFSKTAKCMLEEVKDLEEIAVQKKKGEKVNLRIGDYTLNVILSDYFASKNIGKLHFSYIL